jgi:hypothetical protein
MVSGRHLRAEAAQFQNGSSRTKNLAISRDELLGILLQRVANNNELKCSPPAGTSHVSYVGNGLNVISGGFEQKLPSMPDSVIRAN